MKKRSLIFVSAILIVIGLVLLIGSSSLTGNVISEKIGKTTSSILGLVFIIGGILLFTVGLAEKIKETKKETGLKYFIKRANEIGDPKNKGDVFISQWEVNGLLNELKDRGFQIEYGRKNPGFHIDSPPVGMPYHYSLKKKDESFSKHLFVTRDPNDPRLYTVGVREAGDKVERVKSNVYNPKHPRESGREQTDFTQGIELNYKLRKKH